MCSKLVFCCSFCLKHDYLCRLDSETFGLELDEQNCQTGWLTGVLQQRQSKEPLVSFKCLTVFFSRYFFSSQQAIDTRKCSNSNLSGETADVTIRGEIK